MIPDIHFYLPLDGTFDTNPPQTMNTIHGPYPIYRPVLDPYQSTLTYFGQALTIAPPPLVPAALMAILVRLQNNKIRVPPGIPGRREELPPGTSGVTEEDYVDYNKFAVMRCVPRQTVKNVAQFIDEEDNDALFNFGRPGSTKLFAERAHKGDQKGKRRLEEAVPSGDCRPIPSTSGRGLSPLGCAQTSESAESAEVQSAMAEARNDEE